MYRRTWELLGASPEPMAFAEVFTSLQQGIIDGQENPLEVVADQRLDEVQDYVMHTDHVIGAVTFIFDSGRFGNFSPELQEILQEEGDAAMRRGTERMISRKRIRDLKPVLVHPCPAYSCAPWRHDPH